MPVRNIIIYGIWFIKILLYTGRYYLGLMPAYAGYAERLLTRSHGIMLF